MIPAAFEYERAASVDEALELLARHGGDAKVLAGGQSLLPLMKLRLARPERLIDIGRLGELRGVHARHDGGLAIRALTTCAELLDDSVIGQFGVFADALPRIGDIQVRNRGTIGGSIVHADPAADLPAVLLALDAVVIARSAARGERAIDVRAFFEGAFTTALAEDELLTEIHIPAPATSVGSAYFALEQQASGYPIAGVAAVVGPDLIRIAVTGVGEHPYRATRMEAALEDWVSGSGSAGGRGAFDHPGSPPNFAAVAAAIELITDGVVVSGDIHADPEYRTAMARVMAMRAIGLARMRLG